MQHAAQHQHHARDHGCCHGVQAFCHELQGGIFPKKQVLDGRCTTNCKTCRHQIHCWESKMLWARHRVGSFSFLDPFRFCFLVFLLLSFSISLSSHLLRKQDAVAGLCSKAACTQAPCQRRLSGMKVSLCLWPVVVASGSNMTLKRSDRVQMSADNALHAACQLCTCC